jgi:hypothetical protein
MDSKAEREPIEEQKEGEEIEMEWEEGVEYASTQEAHACETYLKILEAANSTIEVVSEKLTNESGVPGDGIEYLEQAIAMACETATNALVRLNERVRPIRSLQYEEFYGDQLERKTKNNRNGRA